MGEALGEILVFELEDGIIVGHDGPNLVFNRRGDYWKKVVDSVASIVDMSMTGVVRV